MTKRLYKSRDNKVLAGVLGGVGKYFDVDPVLVRLIYILIAVGTGVVPGIVVYILGALIIPEKPVIIAASSDDAPTA